MAKKRKKPKMEFRYYQMSAGSPILALLGQKWVQNYGNDVDYLHFHNYLEIGFCYEGDGFLVLGEDEPRFSGREFTVIPPNYPHTTNSDVGTISRWEYLFIDVEGFMKRFLDSPVKAEKMIQRIYSKALFLREEEYPSISAKILKIMNIMRDGEEFYLEEAKGVLAALLVEIARLNRPSEEDRVAEETGKLTNMITRVLDFVSYHYMEDIKVEDLAKSCHISETHFRRIFTSYMKVTPLEYINTVRIQTACELLQKTDDPVADIAHKCGFTTNSTFNRNFKQIMGVTPIEWRKRPESYEQQILKFDIHSEEGW
ncbi:helix-turn-helix transcriptional regulator [Blautia glucerasea]|uniref:helix-turn-helix transcriptional regulator n=1 Tax=Blautia glucerasea TaxID=536633 RepID=UPI001D083058|nr:AraC family transcriptional regulator [Blautia glucerasea]MCB6546700.1 AraC family transcriptional regulator [Blautia glucerasea]